MSQEKLTRFALKASLPEATSVSGGIVDARQFYVPPAHLKVLERSATIVSGGRGAGKSFWAAALTHDATLEILAGAEPSLEGFRGVRGFAERSDISAYPDESTLRRLLDEGMDVEDVWRGVVLRAVAASHGVEIPTGDWGETARWVAAHPEHVARAMEAVEAALARTGEGRLIVFDALDRSARDWDTMDLILRGLLRVVLWLRSFERLRAKVFLRDDQLTRGVRAFPDASKLTATAVELSWQSHDLHALLWQYLLNGPGDDGEPLRAIYRDTVGKASSLRNARFEVNPPERRDGATQRALFAALAGTQMGRDHRRGVPYTWIVSHLADAKGQTSPRSFLAAIRAAAEDTIARYPDHDLPLHFESIKRGVQMASQIRVGELAEDFPWVRDALEVLKGLNVPCEFAGIRDKWAAAYPEGLPERKDGEAAMLPPPHGESWEGVAKDLERLGIFATMRDGRINMPDLYRVGFGLGRRGGVRPVRGVL